MWTSLRKKAWLRHDIDTIAAACFVGVAVFEESYRRGLPSRISSFRIRLVVHSQKSGAVDDLDVLITVAATPRRR